MKNPCDEFIKGHFEFRYCPDYDSSETIVNSLFNIAYIKFNFFS